MARRQPRGLSPEDRALWQKVAESASPLHSDQRTKGSEAPEKPKTVDHAHPPLAEFQIGQTAPSRPAKHDVAPGIEVDLMRGPVNIDKRSYDRLRRGKLVPEARIDLHGMTLAQAHPALISFIRTSHGAGKRLVLVITGKGRGVVDEGPIPSRRGVLRHQVPHWLAMPPIGPMVLQVTPAHQKHGGGGAYYVYLRRHR